MESVIIAGGGPTGLMLACELRLAGVDVLVLERLAEPSGESRAGGIHARTMEVLDQRGMLEPFLAAGRPLQAGHFAGIPLDFGGFETRYPYLLAILQRRIERLLEARARSLGVRIRREVSVVGLRQDASSVQVETTAGTFSARYLVGCDGGRSAVRRLAGIDFPGTPATMTAILGDVELAAPPARPVFQQRTPRGNYSALDFEPGWYRVSTNEFDVVADRDSPITVDGLRAALIRVAGTDFGMHSPRWISRYNDAARQATAYRSGRVLLAGDAAHIHYPAGGQGLNTGVQDAVNLGWKLAMVVQGRSGDELLDSYHAERHPVGARVLENTRAQTALTRPDAQTEALRSVFEGLIGLDDVNRGLGLMVTGLDIRYPMGDGHPLLGRRVPDYDLPDGSRVYEHLHTGHALLLGGPSSVGVRGLAAGRADVVESKTEALLVRPDGHVAWAEPLGDAALRAALDRWCPQWRGER
jgi:2-polyprenyl-6-methoxyphenol hydroxylase-like FAD-dependent oxidoreductase